MSEYESIGVLHTSKQEQTNDIREPSYVRDIRELLGGLWFRSVLESAVGGDPDDTSQECLLALSLLCM